jgi:hypothetical protein
MIGRVQVTLTDMANACKEGGLFGAWSKIFTKRK